MNTRDRLLAIVCVTLWGLQFVVTEIALRDVGPLLLVALRFLPVAVVTVLFVPRPRVQLRWLIGYGLGLGLVEFALLFWAMDAGLPSGLAALVLQSQAPFTVLLGALLLGHHPSRQALAGLALCATGLVLVAVTEGERAALGPVLLAVAAGFSWAVANLCAARAQAPDPFAFSLWMTTIPPLPMIVAALVVEGPERTMSGLAAFADGPTLWLCVGYLAVLSTTVGTGIWTVLLSRYPTNQVAPLSTLVPVIGLVSGAVFLGEQLTGAILAGGALVIIGLLLVTRKPATAAASDDLPAEAQLEAPPA